MAQNLRQENHREPMNIHAITSEHNLHWEIHHGLVGYLKGLAPPWRGCQACLALMSLLMKCHSWNRGKSTRPWDNQCRISDHFERVKTASTHGYNTQIWIHEAYQWCDVNNDNLVAFESNSARRDQSNCASDSLGLCGIHLHLDGST